MEEEEEEKEEYAWVVKRGVVGAHGRVTSECVYGGNNGGVCRWVRLVVYTLGGHSFIPKAKN